MRFKEHHCIDLASEGIRAVSFCLVVFAGGVTCANNVQAQTPSAARRIVTPSEQSGRDSERIEILRQELKKSEQQLESLEQRKTERLAASDPQAASEAQEQQARIRADIAGLQRELASASRSSDGNSTDTHPANVRADPKRFAGVRHAERAATPWWDVYGGDRRLERSGTFPTTPAQTLDVRGAVAVRREE